MTKKELLYFAFQAGAIHGWSNHETLTEKEIKERFEKWCRDFQANNKTNKRKRTRSK